MDAVLRQSKAVCPFLKQASPATLRALSTTATRSCAATGEPIAASALAATAASSPCGCTLSKLQLLAHRCPVMGKAMAVQAGRAGTGRVGVAAGGIGMRGVAASLSAAFSTSAAAASATGAAAGTHGLRRTPGRAGSTQRASAAARPAKLHSTGSQEARAVEGLFNDKGRTSVQVSFAFRLC